MSELNDNHRRHLLHGFLAIEEGLTEIEALTVGSEAASPFSPWSRDLSPTESRVISDHIARIRAAMATHLEELAIPLDFRRKSLRWCVETRLIQLQTTVDDMGPRQFSGYGPLDATGQVIVTSIQDDLTRLFDRARASIRQGQGRDLASRLSRLDAASGDASMLNRLERIVGRWQLVEYRPTLEMIVDRLEKPCFEIAVFGRVSSGKSSLLNHIAGLDILPVGVTPITAVPTRLEHGQSEMIIVSFTESRPRRIPRSQLWEYASEEGNPANRKHVTRIVVQLRSPRLRNGVVLVDTPGIGSLATSGAAEAMAYLPRCDLGIVLVDATSTLNRDDIELLRALYESGVPAMVLLSKVDLLALPDRERLTTYISTHLVTELGLQLPVHPVSVVGADESLLSTWFDRDVSPRLDRHVELVKASIHRKIASVSESVIATLETMLRRRGDSDDGKLESELTGVRRLLDQADEAIRRARQAGDRLVGESRTARRYHPSTCRAGGGGQRTRIAGGAGPAVPGRTAGAVPTGRDGRRSRGGTASRLFAPRSRNCGASGLSPARSRAPRETRSPRACPYPIWDVSMFGILCCVPGGVRGFPDSRHAWRGGGSRRSSARASRHPSTRMTASSTSGPSEKSSTSSSAMMSKSHRSANRSDGSRPINPIPGRAVIRRAGSRWRPTSRCCVQRPTAAARPSFRQPASTSLPLDL